MKKLVVFSVVLFENVLAEYVAVFILDTIASYTFATKYDSKELTIALLCIIPIVIIFYQLFLFLWKYATYKKGAPAVFIFSLIPMFLLFLSALLFTPALLDGTMVNSPLIIICSLIALLANAILLYAILHRQEKQSIQASYLELQELYEMESEYYQTLEAHHEELSKMRHDYRNHLAVLYALIASGNAEAAKELAASLKNH